MRLDQPLADREAESAGAHAAGRLPAGGRDVLAKELRQHLRRHAAAVVANRQRHVAAVRCGGHVDGGRLRRVPGGVGQQVAEHLYDALAVGHHRRQPVRQVDGNRVPGAAGVERGARRLDQNGHAHRLRRDRQRARLDAPCIEEVADQPLHVVRLGVDDAEELQQLGRRQRGRGAERGGGRALDGGERGAQLVAHHAEELRPLPLDLLERGEVLERDHHRDGALAGRTDRRDVEQGAHGPAISPVLAAGSSSSRRRASSRSIQAFQAFRSIFWFLTLTVCTAPICPCTIFALRCRFIPELVSCAVDVTLSLPILYGGSHLTASRNCQPNPFAEPPWSSPLFSGFPVLRRLADVRFPAYWLAGGRPGHVCSPVLAAAPRSSLSKHAKTTSSPSDATVS